MLLNNILLHFKRILISKHNTIKITNTKAIIFRVFM